MKKFSKLLVFTIALSSLSAIADENSKTHAKALNPNGFNSTECKRQEHYKAFQKSDPAFFALMAHLCNWSNPMLPWDVKSYRSLWSKIANGEDVSTYDIKEFEALFKAKETYDKLSQKKDEYSLPILGFEATDLLYSMIDRGKLNLLKEAQLKFYLKLYDCKLVDGDVESISGNAFGQIFNINDEGSVTGLHQNSAEILSRVFDLEKKYWSKKKAAGAACSPDFASSPLQLFSEAISISLKQDIEINPKSQAAIDLSNAMRGLAREFNGKKVTPEMDQTIKSLSLSIGLVEKNAPRKK